MSSQHSPRWDCFGENLISLAVFSQRLMDDKDHSLHLLGNLPWNADPVCAGIYPQMICSEINYGRKTEGIGWQCGREEPREGRLSLGRCWTAQGGPLS